ncbi:MAG: hypothetical protein JST63_20270 [Bacteroidetes bacterium]|nr:hypothetical protein [Bacteroidota bacterium]
MWTKCRHLVIIVLIFSTPSIFGQTGATEKITEKFFKTYKQSPTKAYADLFVDNKWMKDKKSDIETVKIKMNDFLSGLGDYYGYELVTEKSAGESYILKSFLIKYERQPIRFTFLLYRPNDEWQIQNFTYDTNIEGELEEAAKAYRLKNNW